MGSSWVWSPLSCSASAVAKGCRRGGVRSVEAIEDGRVVIGMVRGDGHGRDGWVGVVEPGGRVLWSVAREMLNTMPARTEGGTVGLIVEGDGGPWLELLEVETGRSVARVGLAERAGWRSMSVGSGRLDLFADGTRVWHASGEGRDGQGRGVAVEGVASGHRVSVERGASGSVIGVVGGLVVTQGADGRVALIGPREDVAIEVGTSWAHGDRRVFRIREGRLELAWVGGDGEVVWRKAAGEWTDRRLLAVFEGGGDEAWVVAEERRGGGVQAVLLDREGRERSVWTAELEAVPGVEGLACRRRGCGPAAMLVREGARYGVACLSWRGEVGTALLEASDGEVIAVARRAGRAAIYTRSGALRVIDLEACEIRMTIDLRPLELELVGTEAFGPSGIWLVGRGGVGVLDPDSGDVRALAE